MTQRRTITKRKKLIRRRKHPWMKILSFFQGEGGIFVIFILASIMAGAFALTGGLTPVLNPAPSSQDQVIIDEDSAKRSNEKSLQLVDIKIKPTDTPTPTPSSTPTLTPTPQQACLNKTVLTLILDVSTSMNANNKMGQLNDALKNLISQLNDETVIGAIEFAGLASFPNTNGANTLLPYTRYKDNKSLIQSRLSNLQVHTTSLNDGTYFRSAFTRAINNINAVKGMYASQGYNFVTIVFTDGVPETQYTDHDCLVEINNPYICFSNKQDPRYDLTDRLKSISNRVYSIGIYSGQRERAVLTQAKQLLADIASKPSYTKSSDNPAAITSLFQDTLSTVCNQ
ncbi:MAG: hypothetical protein KatS3mg089_0207 [Patescibacteria group bacterium]|nr:MAG: hypothetical protein KatS3mg089_0207 [Patescibacteria group bacterium]